MTTYHSQPIRRYGTPYYRLQSGGRGRDGRLLHQSDAEFVNSKPRGGDLPGRVLNLLFRSLQALLRETNQPATSLDPHIGIGRSDGIAKKRISVCFLHIEAEGRDVLVANDGRRTELLKRGLRHRDDVAQTLHYSVHGVWIGLGELGPPDAEDVMTVVETDFNVPFLRGEPSPVHQM